ncbi:aminotransferase class IV [Oculatella sp. LEGE 06141]|uniref:aminotransferase class IV n=1 Tax=Oculatella sp. LEGE 06141 TaxID=1828648 RepID=UPI00187E15D6|nr:aminotransferase class IV [Oculatella sp. LEGE 06141]MBE9177208.1 aminotransferase class IV [Oculatella sp. LEGE 06141]
MSSLSHWYNGQMCHSGTVELAIDDPGLLYGATLFTTMRIYQRSLEHPLTAWQAHCDRLQQSLSAFGWQPPDWQRVQHGAAQLGLQYPVLRITLFADGREWITGRHLPDGLAQRQKKGIAAWLADGSEFHRPLASHKTGNYLSTWLARQAAAQHAGMEAILTNPAGDWLETATGNLWGWRDGGWWTPPISEPILSGIARSQLISWLKWQNEGITEEPWDEELVLGFEAIAYSNCVVQLIPIHTVLRPSKSLTYNATHAGLQRLCGLFHSVSH